MSKRSSVLRPGLAANYALPLAEHLRSAGSDPRISLFRFFLLVNQAVRRTQGMPHALAIFLELVYAGYVYLKIGLAGQYVITGQIGARFCHALSLMPGWRNLRAPFHSPHVANRYKITIITKRGACLLVELRMAGRSGRETKGL